MSGAYQTSRKEQAHEDSAWAVLWTNDDKIVSGSIDETVKVWAPKTETSPVPKLEEVSTFTGHFLGVVSMSASSDGRLCACSSLDGRLRIWNLDDKSLVKLIDPGPVEAWTVAMHPQGQLVAAGSQTGNVNIFGVGAQGDKPEAVLTPHNKFIMSVAYSPDGRLVASGAMDGAVHVMDSVSGNLIRKLEGHSKAVRGLSFSPDSKVLLTGCEDMTVIMHDVSQPSGTVATLTGHDSWVLSVAHSPAGGECITGSSDKRVRVWDLGQRQCVYTSKDHTDQVWSVDYNSSGSKFVSASDDGSVMCGVQVTG
mmetsp:Transcript_12331/g.31862  ORF Transcript_12331/g.31862 Transcript_12331/m.31862 type:complete len:309 (-) Transcript_12331:27-953(-)